MTCELNLIRLLISARYFVLCHAFKCVNFSLFANFFLYNLIIWVRFQFVLYLVALVWTRKRSNWKLLEPICSISCCDTMWEVKSAYFFLLAAVIFNELFFSRISDTYAFFFSIFCQVAVYLCATRPIYIIRAYIRLLLVSSLLYVSKYGVVCRVQINRCFALV